MYIWPEYAATATAVTESAPLGGGDEVDLPDYLREEAGIPEKAKLFVSVDEEEHTVTISEADYNHDLRDVPEEVLEMFRGAEVCVGELEERPPLRNRGRDIP